MSADSVWTGRLFVVSAAVFAYGSQPVSAAEVLHQLQTEAIGVSVAGAGPGVRDQTYLTPAEA